MIKYIKNAYMSAILITVAIITVIIFVRFPEKKQENPVKSDHPKENISSPAGADNNITSKGKHISYSPVKEYMMKAESDSINIYEIYENGYREKIKSIDIIPEQLRKNDASLLKKGIIVSTYNEICHMIEDFSS